MTKLSKKTVRTIAITVVCLILVITFAWIAVARTSTEEEPVESPKAEFTTTPEITVSEEPEETADPVVSEEPIETVEEIEESSAIVDVPEEPVMETPISEPEPVELESVEPEPVDPPTNTNTGTVYTITSAERDMLAAIVYLECGIESYECQKAICSVIINRWQSGYWGSTIADVIYAPNQFTPAYKISSTTPTATQYQVVDDVINNGTSLPYYVMYFRANYYFDWATPYTAIDHTYFSYLPKDV